MVPKILILLELLCLISKSALAVECTKYVKVAAGDYCYKLWTDNGLTEAEFRSLNPDIYCDALQIGQQICVSAASSSDDCSKTYKIVAGDYCYKIWTDNNLTESEFHDLNPNINCDALQIGQEICLKKGCTKKYKIKSGDYCYKLWTDNGLTEAEFHALNPDVNCDALQVGQEVCLDPPTTTPTTPTLQGCFNEHEIIAGDTCLTLQQDFMVSMSELAFFNKKLDCNNLQVGQKVCLSSVDTRFECLHYEVFTSDLCQVMKERFNITLDQFKTLNYGDDCASSKVSSRKRVSQSQLLF